MKTTKEDYALYKRWEKHILDSHPKLSDGIVRVTLIAYCLALAIHGSNGRDCYASNTTLARKLGINRDTGAKYRDEAIRLGWFTPTDKRVGRVEKLNVSIPDEPADTASQISANVVSSEVRETGCQCLGCVNGGDCLLADAE